MIKNIISASILSADFANLGKDVSDVLNDSYLHVYYDVLNEIKIEE